MFGLNSYTEQFRELFTETKRYLELEKRYLAMDAAEKMTILLSAVATGAVCLVIASMTLFFVLLAAGLWIGQIIGNFAIGFVGMAFLLLLLLGLFWLKRQDWIVQPLARLMVSLFIREEEAGEEVADE